MKRLVPLLALLLLPGLSNADSNQGERERAVHALNRLAFGAKPGDIERVMQVGVDRWIEQQLHPERIDDRAVDAKVAQYETLRMSNDQILNKFYIPLAQARKAAKKDGDGGEEQLQEMRRMIPQEQRPQRVVMELSSQRIVRAAESDRQLNEVMTDFWLNHFNVFAGKGLDRFLLTSYERDVIRPHVWGKFEDLLLATAKSPAMLFYLDNARSKAGGLNENYAREIMELHTLGVDGGYSQKDVTELARVFTGWTLAGPRRGGATFIFRPRLHDAGEKTVLGVHFKPGGGMEEGERMIRVLAHHPATAHHIAYKLCQRLVADEPPASLVDRVAKRFLETNGDLRETVKAVVTSAEFRDPKYFNAKVKSPFEFAMSAVRSIGGRIDDPKPLARELQRLGEPLYGAQPPTGYSDKADAWVNTGGLMARMNFAVALTENKLPGVMVDTARLDPRNAALTLGGPEFQKQ